MAHRVFGIDFGAHSVKLAELGMGFRTLTLSRLENVEVRREPGDVLKHGIRALGELIENDSMLEIVPGDIVAVTIPGDLTVLRSYQVPFSDAKKANAVIANELADDLPWELEEVVFHQQQVSPAGVSQSLVAAARSADVEQILSGLGELGIDPRQVMPAPLAYSELLRRLAPGRTVGVIDLGHQRTNVSLVQDGRIVAARTVSKAGAYISEAIRQSMHVSMSEAEAIKLKSGNVLLNQQELQAADVLTRVTTRSVATIVTEIRQSIRILSGRTRVEPQELVLCGGTSRMRGVAQYVQQVIGVPVSRISFEFDEQLAEAGLDPEGEALGALAIGAALEQGRRHSINLRQGQFAFKMAKSALRDKAVPLTLSVVAIFGVCFTRYLRITLRVASRKRPFDATASANHSTRVWQEDHESADRSDNTAFRIGPGWERAAGTHRSRHPHHVVRDLTKRLRNNGRCVAVSC